MNRTFAIVGTASVKMPATSHCPPLARALVNLGYSEVSMKDATYLVAMNHESTSYQRFMENGGLTKNAVLIRVEPPAVHPSQYTAKIEKLYANIVTPGLAIFDSDMENFIGWPYEIHKNPSRPSVTPLNLFEFVKSEEFIDQFSLTKWKGRKNKFHLIAANKVSPTNQSNYQLRRRIAFSSTPQILDIYGPLWKSPLRTKIRHRLAVLKFGVESRVPLSIVNIYGNLFKSYPAFLGTPEDKFLTSRNYRFALVVENSDTYASEKLIDAMLAGCICVYAGPSIEAAGFPPETAIPYSGNVHQLDEVLMNLQDEEILGYLDAMKAFLASQRFLDSWESDQVFNKIAKRLDENWRNS